MSHAPATPRPRLGGFDALTTLRDFALITYDVDPDRLARLLPSGHGFEPEVVTLNDGRRRGLVSAVNFRDVDFRFVRASWMRATFVQTNYRAYVTRGSEHSVFFFGTTLSSRLAVLPRLMWSMPWYRVDGSLEATWDEQRCLSYVSRSSGGWGNSAIELEGTNETASTLEGFTDAGHAAHVIINPLIGYFERRHGGIGRYGVWHEPLQPTLGRVISARFDAFEERGLIERGQEPHSVLLQQLTDFAVLLPPTRVPAS